MSDFSKYDFLSHRSLSPDLMREEDAYLGLYRNCVSYAWCDDFGADAPYIRKLNTGKYDIFPYGFDGMMPFEPIPFDDLDSSVNYYLLKFS